MYDEDDLFGELIEHEVKPPARPSFHAVWPSRHAGKELAEVFDESDPDSAFSDDYRRMIKAAIQQFTSGSRGISFVAADIRARFQNPDGSYKAVKVTRGFIEQTETFSHNQIGGVLSGLLSSGQIEKVGEEAYTSTRNGDRRGNRYVISSGWTNV